MKPNTKPWYYQTLLFKTVTSTIKNSNDQARKPTKAILNVQNFYSKNN